MAKYDITRSCGHIEEIQLFGKYSDRERAIEFEQGRLCMACYREQHREDAPRAIFRVAASVVSVAIVGNTFAIKDSLKPRGYRFSRDITVPESPLGMEITSTRVRCTTKAGWELTIKSPTSESIQSEIDALCELGCNVEMMEGMGVLFTALGEGRPDLAEPCSDVPPTLNEQQSPVFGSIVAEFRRQVEMTKAENADLLDHMRERGYDPIVDDAEMMAAFEAFIGRGETVPPAHEHGIWFPASLVRLANMPFDRDDHTLNVQIRRDFASASQRERCPGWRTRG